MRTLKKALVLSLIIGVLFGGITLCAFIIYLETSIDKVMSKERQEKLFSEIQKSQELPLHFYTTIEKYYPDYFQQGVWNSIFSQIIGRKRNQCNCREVYLHPGLTDRKWIPFTQEIFALELEERFTQKHCYTYNLSTTNFGYETRGVRNAAKLFYNKDLSELNEREILELHIISKAPYFYNPLRNKNKLQKIVTDLMNKTSKH